MVADTEKGRAAAHGRRDREARSAVVGVGRTRIVC